MVFILDEDHKHGTQARPTGNRFGIDERIKDIIREYDRMSHKPAHMLRMLREDLPPNTSLPTERQLNNFLSTHRAKKELGGNLGNRICLNDFLEIYELNKNVPDDPDQMFVANCVTNVVIDNGSMNRVFRIFFTTTRLLDFTKHVT